MWQHRHARKEDRAVFRPPLSLPPRTQVAGWYSFLYSLGGRNRVTLPTFLVFLSQGQAHHSLRHTIASPSTHTIKRGQAEKKRARTCLSYSPTPFPPNGAHHSGCA